MQLKIRKIDFGARGGYILFDDKPAFEPPQIVNLIQMQPSHYKLDGQKKLHLLLELPSFSERCRALETLLAHLVKRSPRFILGWREYT